MNKPHQIKQKTLDFLGAYKKYIISIIISLTILLIIGMNFNVLQMSYYKMRHNTTGIINIMSKQVKNVKEHKKVYFKSAMNYLIEDMSEPTQIFLEGNFSTFSPSEQQVILSTYNAKELFFIDHTEFLDVALKGSQDESIKAYLKRMPIDKFEIALKDYFGENMKLSQDTVTKVYKIASLYPEKLPLKKFQISVYDLMSFPHNGNDESMALKLLSLLDPEAARESLFKELKTRPIEVDLLNEWVDILNKYKMISTTEYAGFTNSYAGILQLREQYKQLEEQKVDLINLKQGADVQTEGLDVKIKDYQKQIENLNKIGIEKDEKLSKLTRYKTIELYVMDYYGEGQYEASIPEKSWFFNTYKPSDEKVIVKLTSTEPQDLGMYTFNVYDKGVGENGLPYYTEVSKEEMDQISQLKEEIAQVLSDKEQLENQIKSVQEEINKIRKINNYEQNITLLEQVEVSKNNILLKLKEHQVSIQSLFGIGNVVVEITKK